MTITITTCGECPFRESIFTQTGNACFHPERKEFFAVWIYSIHPSCPESGPFTIITKPKNTEDES